MAWWFALALVLAACFILLSLRRTAATLASFAAIYLFLQASARFYLVPWYKDGGNGSVAGDWDIWLFWAALLTAALWCVLAFARLARGSGRASASSLRP